MYTLEDVYKTFPSGCTEDYKILRAFEMGKQSREKQIAELEARCNELFLQTMQLTNAKELLNEFMRISKASDEDFEHDYSELIEQAEQFISEVEK